MSYISNYLLIILVTINYFEIINLKQINAILVGETTTNLKSEQIQSNTTAINSSSLATGVNQLKVSNQHDDTLNTTFYYEANEFLNINDKKPKKSINIKDDVDNNKNEDNGKKLPPAASSSMTSARNGRMMDLDALVGDFALSQSNKDKKLTGDRQSRSFSNMNLGNGKKLHIQGFIPIVGVKDITGDENTQFENNQSFLDSINGNSQNNDNLASSTNSIIRQQKQRAVIDNNSLQLNELPYAQSSIGHATFGVQRYLNSEYPSQQQQQQQFDATKHGGSAATTIIETLKKPIKKITGFSSNQDSQQQHQQQQHNCLCVPFYMCKNGYISESSLGKSQIQQMILQQQQQLLQPSNQFSPNQQQIEMKSGQLISEVPSLQQQQQQQIVKQQQSLNSFDSYAPIDERSFDRDIITMVPLLSSNSASIDQSTINNQSIEFNPSSQSGLISELQQQQQQQNQQNQTTISDGMIEEISNSLNGSSITNFEGTFGSNNAASNDYSQEILGRMLGLKSKASSRQQQQQQGGITTTIQQQQQSGVCGLLRTCCNIPIQLIPSQQDFANEKFMLASTQQQFNSDNNLRQFSQQPSQIIVGHQQPPPQQQQQHQQQQNIYGTDSAASTSVSQFQPQQQIQRFGQNNQQIQSFVKQQLPYGFPSTTKNLPLQQQFSRSQNNLAGSSLGTFYPNITPQMISPTNELISQPSIAHRTIQLSSSSSNKYLQQPNANSIINTSQFTRSLQQQQQQMPQLQSQQQLYSQQQQLQQQAKAIPVPIMRQTTTTTIGSSNILGTRKILDGRCGLRQSAGINGRVQNLQYHENSADFGEYPAQAAILKRLTGSDSLFVCGGTLISQYWIATAAHCIKKHSINDLKVRLGEWDVHRDDEFYPFVEKEIRDLIIHPDFVAGNLINDIALLRLDSPIDPSLPHINPACLPKIDESFTGQHCWVAGWGKDSFGQKGSFQAVLKEVELPIIGHNDCEQALRTTRLGSHYRLHSGFICAGGEIGKDACEGDGGSGLYCVQDGIIKVSGLVSWGIGCGSQGIPGAYVNMAHYRPWIENIISIDEDIYSPITNMIGSNSLISERNSNNNNNNNSSYLHINNEETDDKSKEQINSTTTTTTTTTTTKE